MAGKTVQKTITAQNTFTDPLRVSGQRTINFSITSTALSATIHLQRRRTKVAGSEDAWGDVTSFTTNTEKIIESVGDWEWRAGVKTGGFTSATALVVSLSS